MTKVGNKRLPKLIMKNICRSILAFWNDYFEAFSNYEYLHKNRLRSFFPNQIKVYNQETSCVIPPGLKIGLLTHYSPNLLPQFVTPRRHHKSPFTRKKFERFLGLLFSIVTLYVKTMMLVRAENSAW